MMTAETATHTPGPWHKRVTGEEGSANSIRDANGDMVATYQGRWGPALRGWRVDGKWESKFTWEEREAEAEANGNLIARAPSLLAEVESLKAENARLKAQLATT